MAREITILFRDCINAIIQSNFGEIERESITGIEVPQLESRSFPRSTRLHKTEPSSLPMTAQ